MHGGLGSGIECASCHDADAFIHTPVDRRREGRATAARSSRRWASIPTSRSARTTRRTRSSTAAARAGRCRSRSSRRGERVPQVPPHGRRPLDRRAGSTRLDGTDSSWTGITTDDVQQARAQVLDAARSRVRDGRRVERRRRVQDGARLHPELRREPDAAGVRSGRTSPRRSAATTPAASCATRSRLPDDELAKQATDDPRHEQERADAGLRGVPRAEPDDAARLAGEDGRPPLDDVPQGRRPTGERRNDTTAAEHPRRERRVQDLRPVRCRARARIFEVNIAGTGDVDLYVKRGERADARRLRLPPVHADLDGEVRQDAVQRGRPGEVLHRPERLRGRHGQDHGRSTPSRTRTRPPRRTSSTASASSRATRTRRSRRPSSASTPRPRTSAGSRTCSRRRSPPARAATTPTRGRSSTASSRTASSMPKGNHPRLDAGASSTSSPSGSRAACRG